MKKYSFLILAAGLVILSVTQSKLIMPYVYDVIKSDLFLVQSKDEASRFAISTQMTEVAYQQCNTYIKSGLKADESMSFPEKPLNAWSLGNYDYVISAEVGVTTGTSGTVTKQYACRISYDDKDDEKGVLDFNNWSVSGVSGL
jgi:hypothetical protein